ncbi:MAG: hypothetical protein E6I36_08000 [Chloroflexi bacterium]|nr:MAG: hypothetical protein E6I36_08000 [Chloroflexota bacterium]
MKGVTIVRETLAASAAVAAIALAASVVLGRLDVGAGLAAGLLIGAFNGELLRRMVANRAPFVVSSVFRLALLSAAGILFAYLLHASAIALLIGVACAQFVMVAVAVREGLRA